ncbi:imidazole glycerol phosphate synthase subunit HisH [Acidianus ambivalens]|uniref:Imidazole glycerol phosphate synthase subunit HisH n=1 Tax=Acidianus ambivalens TaxID=2283 RepID=A0A650CSH5_ACIAM|nr:imidazole glycerol phosphate synthase subunit HisH [Acidianus ambivalens]MQL55135.1 imidazole glycerol phosphate synthase subunit HisH [Acidianus ambivalens]QGR20685.1 imidazole glycerol phosphate synthase subunit HisH [Acidianus ambivalens]
MKALVVNYGVGNLFSISSGLKRAGFEVEISKEIKNADLIVFPGVGAFSAVSKFIQINSDKINDLRKSGVHFLGVCLGLQIMFEKGTEGGESKGLGWFKGTVDKIHANVKLPHIGWDKIYVSGDCELTEGLDGKYAYYVHSYVAYTNDHVVMKSNYGIEYPAMVCKENVVGTQFHPEKSSETGRIFFENLKRWVSR